MKALYDSKKAVKYDIKTDSSEDTYYCPEKYPYLCTLLTDNFGLCKKTVEDCDSDLSESELLLLSDETSGKNIEEGKKYGYTHSHLKDYCGNITLDLQQDYRQSKMFGVLPDILPLDTINEDPISEIKDEFSIMTYNIWGLIKYQDNPNYMKFLNETMKLRMKAIVDIVKKNNPDILCIQEMNNTVYRLLKDELSKIYPYEFEPNFDKIDDKDRSIKRNRNLEVFIFSKYKPIRMELYGISGNLGYNNSFIIIEFQNIIIINCYLQAGSKYSPGQEAVWFHYSRCRKQEIKKINTLVDKYVLNGKACILTGDFNCNLNGNLKEWPELSEFSNLNDTWTKLNLDKEGLTEDTDINQMRWNNKFMEKKFRYDGIFYKNPADNDILKPLTIKITGRKPIVLDKKMSEEFIKYFVPDKRESLLRYYDQTKGLLALWPSDHFAVYAIFQILDTKITINDNKEVEFEGESSDTEKY